MKKMRRLLIANRGEIARRVLRTARCMGIETVAVYSDADARALHVREAGTACALGGNASVDTYLNIGKLIAAARASGADAVHPGYGFLSENADFAQAVIDAGLIWVGPPPAAIRALGNKAGARQLAQLQGVPCLPGYQGVDQSDERFAVEAHKIGYPVMVKASAGGGGRGMRLVSQPQQLVAALISARSEALGSFGSGELLIERALLNPRHVEVQVFADAHGHCIHLGERDCSVQRRHQKIIEESPSPAVDARLRARMGACAVALARAAGYVGAGTVEFLLDAPDVGPHASLPPEGAAGTLGQPGGAGFFLMEMNTRLQVEHPVTEAITGLDLVEWQLRVAQGESLPLTQEQVRFTGHAIEVRLCAEDEHYAPHAGRVVHFAAPGQVRFDHALDAGLDVPPYYDSMLGKLIAHGDTREHAIDRLSAALADTVVLGLPTNRAFLAACLAHPMFRAGQARIPFLAEHGDALRETLHQKEQESTVLAGLAVVFASNTGAGSLPCPFPRPVRLQHRGQTLDWNVRELGGGAVEVAAGQQRHQAMLAPACAGRRVVTLDGVRCEVIAVPVDAARWHIQLGAAAGAELWLEDMSFEPAAQAGRAQGATDLRAPFNGKLIALPVAAGQAVQRGDLLAVIESMKLEHALAASRDGVVQAVRVEVGQQVATAQILVTFEAA